MNRMMKMAAKQAPRMAMRTMGRRKKMMLKAGHWAARQMLRKQQPSMGSMVLKGLGAAAVAVPVGMWLGRRMMSGQQA